MKNKFILILAGVAGYFYFKNKSAATVTTATTASVTAPDQSSTIVMPQPVVTDDTLITPRTTLPVNVFHSMS